MESVQTESYTVSQDFATSVPVELRERRQWICWRYNHDKSKKPAVDPITGRNISYKKSDRWLHFDQATLAVEKRGHDGVAFVCTEHHPYAFLDIDGVIDPETGEVQPWAAALVREMDSYTEISPSGRGLRIIVRAKMGFGKAGKAPLELFCNDGYVTITGRVFHDAPIRDAQEHFERLYREHYRKPEPDHRAEIMPLGKSALTDDEVMRKAKSNRKTGERFATLYDSGSTVPKGERSEADYFVIKGLAIRSGFDAEQVKRLFRRSDLIHGHYADAGHHGESYLDRTVANAIRENSGRFDPDQGKEIKAKVCAVVRGHRERLERSDLRGSRRDVMRHMLDIAEEVGHYRDGGIEFNRNQYAIAEAVSVTQPMVSKAIKDLMGEGWIVRTSKGSKKSGKNSKYRLPMLRDGEEEE